MNGGRPCKRARIDLNAVPDDDGGINLSSMSKLTPGKHVINVSCSKVGNNLDELVSSSNQRMHALFGDDQNINVRRFAQGFGFGDSSGDALKSMDREFADVECDTGKNSNVFDLNSIPESSCINNGNQFERSEMDEVNVRSNFEVGSSSRCQTECDLANDEGHAFEFNELDEDDEHVLSDNEFCEDDDDLFDEGEPCLEMTSVDYHGVGYSDLGDCDFSCRYCGAKFWFKEKVNPKVRSRVPVFSLCCSKGKVKLPTLGEPPQYLQMLFFDENDPISKHFQQNIRAYNMMFSFTSMGGKVDNRVNDGRGRYVYRISGQNHHRMGSLLPFEGQSPKFAQLYIYDTENEVANRMVVGRSSRSRAGPDYDTSIVEGLKKMIDEYNPIAKVFRMTRDCLRSQEFSNMKLKLIRRRDKDSRLYNLPTVDEIAALIPGDIDINNVERDIIVETREGRLQRIHELHPLYVPMHYPVFFPYGEDGYCDNSAHLETTKPDERRKGKITLCEFFSFRFQERDQENAIYLYVRRLFQQFVVDAYTMIESWRLTYFRAHQKKLRQSVYRGLVDVVYQGEREGCAVGKRIVLPSSFTGGARYMMQNYQDAMSICRWAGYPDVFLTFTCNPKWPEITRHLKKKCLKAEDRPDIVVRIFRMKLRELMDDLKSGKVFGKVKAIIYTIEFQKRGLPHAHILLFLQPQCKHPNPEDIDKIISAEIPDPNENPVLYQAVKEFMMHGSCGNCDQSSPCMVNGRCSKHFPKDWVESTTINEDGYPVYRRSEYVSPCEAMWRIYSFEINFRQPAVERLKFHLPGEQSVVFEDRDDIGEVVFKRKGMVWQPRKRGLTIGRLIYVPPSAGELFYLSMLLHQVKGPQSYEDIRTVNGVVQPTFREACYRLGLLDDDREFIEAIKQAADWGSGHMLRSLFVSILMSNSVSKPEHVWESTWRELSEDLVLIPRRRIISASVSRIEFSDIQIQTLGLVEIEKHLRKLGKCLADFPNMPLPDMDEQSKMSNQLILEQLSFDRNLLAQEYLELYAAMTEEQKSVFDSIVSSVEEKKGGFFFLNGYGGTGKTFLWRALTAKLRSMGEIVLCVASSGIAATLLPLARTTHSRFAIPIAISEESTCSISQGSMLAELIKKTSLII